MRKEITVSIALITLLFFGTASFVFFLENNVYTEIVQLSPGNTSALTLLDMALGLFWIVAILTVAFRSIAYFLSAIGIKRRKRLS